jgi:hypothetical protein
MLEENPIKIPAKVPIEMIDCKIFVGSKINIIPIRETTNAIPIFQFMFSFNKKGDKITTNTGEVINPKTALAIVVFVVEKYIASHIVVVTTPKTNNHLFFFMCLISFNDLVIFSIGRSVIVENNIRRNATKRKLTSPINL